MKTTVSGGDLVVAHPDQREGKCRAGRALIAGVVLLLALTNLLNNAWAPGAHLVVSPLVAVLLLLMVRQAGLSWADLGLGRANVARVLRRGGAVVLLTVAGTPGAGVVFEFRALAG